MGLMGVPGQDSEDSGGAPPFLANGQAGTLLTGSSIFSDTPWVATSFAVGQPGNTVSTFAVNRAIADATIQFALNILPTWSVNGVEGTGVRIAMTYAAGVTKADGAGLVVEGPLMGVGSAISGSYFSGLFRGSHGAAGIVFSVSVAIETSANGTLWVASESNPTAAVGGILFGSSRDTNLYRNTTSHLMTDGSLRISGRLGVTGASQASAAINVEGIAPVSGGISRSLYFNPTYGSGTTSSANGFTSEPLTQAAAFTLTTLIHMNATSVVIGAGSAVTTQYGVFIGPMSTATNNYGIAIGKASNITLWIARDADYTTAAAGVAFGVSADTNLYRGAANQLKTDDSFNAAAYLVGGTAGADFGPGLPTSVTVVKGIITAIS
jgi:hypothetical protein